MVYIYLDLWWCPTNGIFGIHCISTSIRSSSACSSWDSIVSTCKTQLHDTTWLHDRGCIPTEVSFESFETCPCQEGKSHENQEDFFKGASLFFVNHSNDINKFSPPKKKSLGLRGTQLVDHCKGFKQRIFFFIGSMGFVISIPIHERLISMGNYMKLLGFN